MHGQCRRFFQRAQEREEIVAVLTTKQPIFMLDRDKLYPRAIDCTRCPLVAFQIIPLNRPADSWSIRILAPTRIHGNNLTGLGKQASVINGLRQISSERGNTAFTRGKTCQESDWRTGEDGT